MGERERKHPGGDKHVEIYEYNFYFKNAPAHLHKSVIDLSEKVLEDFIERSY